MVPTSVPPCPHFLCCFSVKGRGRDPTSQGWAVKETPDGLGGSGVAQEGRCWGWGQAEGHAASCGDTRGAAGGVGRLFSRPLPEGSWPWGLAGLRKAFGPTRPQPGAGLKTPAWGSVQLSKPGMPWGEAADRPGKTGPGGGGPRASEPPSPQPTLGSLHLAPRGPGPGLCGAATLSVGGRGPCLCPSLGPPLTKPSKAHQCPPLRLGSRVAPHRTPLPLQARLPGSALPAPVRSALWRGMGVPQVPSSPHGWTEGPFLRVHHQ